MVLFIILGAVVLITFVDVGVLLFLLSQEGQKEEPVFTPKASLPTQEAQTSSEDEKYKKRVQEIEDELLAISKKAAGQSDEAKQVIESLTKENESLKSKQAELEQAQQKLLALQEEASNLTTQNAALQIQLESVNATVSELHREKEALLSAPKSDIDEALRRELESLKYELIKARAQSSGLERVSFNYKNQLEDFFKKINAAQVSNDHLSQVKNRLEGMVEEIKLQNEALAQKDRLAQFELEKNRSRLVSLEREYEDLKARTHQKDHP